MNYKWVILNLFNEISTKTQRLNHNLFKGQHLVCKYYQLKFKKFKVKKPTNDLRFTLNELFVDMKKTLKILEILNMAGGKFASAKVEKLIRTAGAHRVSADAVDRLNEILTTYGTDLAKYAVEIARHSGRKTVKENDVKLASQK